MGIKNRLIFFSGYNRGVWLGFHDMNHEGQFVSLSSGGGNLCYSNWHQWEPNDAGGEDCVMFIRQTNTWNDLKCSKYLNYVCKK